MLALAWRKARGRSSLADVDMKGSPQVPRGAARRAAMGIARNTRAGRVARGMSRAIWMMRSDPQVVCLRNSSACWDLASDEHPTIGTRREEAGRAWQPIRAENCSWRPGGGVAFDSGG